MGSIVVNPAESTAAEPQPNFQPETFTDEQRSTWLATGAVPKTPAVEPTQAGTPQGDERAESAPESIQQEKPKPPAAKNGEERKAELAREIHAKLEERKAVQKEWDEFEAYRKGKSGVTAEPPAAAPKSDAKSGEPVEPKFGETDGETWEQFEVRQKTFIRELARYEARQLLAEERAATEKQAAEAATQKSWDDRVLSAKSRHADYAEVAFSASTPLTKAMKDYVLDSPHGALVLYELGKNSGAEAHRIVAIANPAEAITELAKIALSVSEPPAEPAKPKPPVVPITKAARPALDLQATNSAPADDLRAAVEANDFTRFVQLSNSRDIARRKQG